MTYNLKIGNEEYNSVYIGNNNINRIYQGQDLIWLKSIDGTYTYFGSVGADHEHYADITEISSNSTQCIEGELVNNYDITYVNSDEQSKLSCIGDNAFYVCSNLSSITCPNIIEIGDNAFYECSNLSSINCSNVINIGPGAFINCINLSSINCPNVTQIEDSAFYCCSSLTSVNCPTVKSINYGAFYGCKNLKHLYLSSVTKVTTIKFYHVFYDVSHCSVYVPNSLLNDFKEEPIWKMYLEAENIDFVGVGEEQKHYTYFGSVGADHEHYADITDFLSESQTCLKGETIKNSDITYLCSDFNSKLTNIKEKAFYVNKNIKYVNCPTVTNISDNAFAGCSNLSSINCLNAIDIGNTAFAMTNISSINLPNVKIFKSSTFLKCTNLKSINCQNILTVENEVFYKCQKLQALELPNVISIDNNGWNFYNCFNLSTISISSTNSNFRLLTKDNELSNSGIVLIDENSHNVIWGSIPECENVILPNDVSSIADAAFDYCQDLKYVNCPNVTNINDTFNDCNNLTVINCPNVTNINDGAFWNTKSLLSVILSNMTEDNLTKIGSYTFGYDSGQERSYPVSVCIPYGFKDKLLQEENWPNLVEDDIIELVEFKTLN